MTNNPTILASSEIMTSITKKVKKDEKTFENSVLTASVTTEYPEKVKVVSLYKD